MGKTIFGLMVLFVVVVSATNLSAGKRIDYGWSADMYKYDIVSGEVASVNFDSKALKLDDQYVYFTNDTKFYGGSLDTDIESVYGGPEFSDKDRIMANDIKEGKLMKCRYSRDAQGRLFLDTCLIEK